MRRSSAVAGLFFVVLAFASRIVEGAVPDPVGRNALTRFAHFYASRAHTRGAFLAVVIGVIGLFAITWFLGGLWSVLRDGEGVTTGPLIVVAIGGVAFVALGIASALLLNEAGRGLFLGAMLAAGATTAAAGVVLLRTRVWPAWLARLGIAIAVACVPTIPPVSKLAALGLAVWVLAASALMLMSRDTRQPAVGASAIA